MAHIISPYDRRETGSILRLIGLGVAAALSVAFHLLVAWVFIFVFPSLMTDRDRPLDFIPVQLYGDLAPAAPAAPEAPVNPDLKGPDVVKAPASDPALAQPQFTPAPPEAVTAPADVIPLGPKEKAPEKPPEIKKVSPPPKITPPKVEKPKPPKPKPNPDAEINKRMEELQRKVAARENQDQEATHYNTNIDSGRGQGDSSERSGASGGQRVHPEMARYYEHVRDIVSSNWVQPADSLPDSIEAHYYVTIDPSGRILAVRLVRSSGYQSYDQSVQRAITKSNPLPGLPPIFEGRTIVVGLIFNPGDLRRRSRQMS